MSVETSPKWLCILMHAWALRHICRTKLEEERRKVQQIIEAMPKRSIKKTEDPQAGVGQ